MSDGVPVYVLNLPEYQVDKEPNHETIGKKVDDFLKLHFLGQKIVVRCLGSLEHPGKKVDEVISLIQEMGTDRYDPTREGDRYENNEGRHIDIFAFDYDVKPETEMFKIFTWPFYHYRSKFTGGQPVRIDIITIYDPEALEQIQFSYKGREHEGLRTDGWVFKDPEHKISALKAIIKIT